MKSLTQSLLIVIVFTIVPLASQATQEPASPAVYQLPSYQVEDMSLPVPSKIVAPRLRSAQYGKQVKMIFTVTEKGQAKYIRSSQPFKDDRELVMALTRVLKQWEFEPARDANGIAKKVKVSLPIKVLKGVDSSGYVTQLAVAKPSIVADASSGKPNAP